MAILQQTDLDTVLQKIKQNIEQHYADKFAYALPEWAMFSGEPSIIAVLAIHGEEGLRIAKQSVNFDVDFNVIESVLYYVDFLKDQMNVELDRIGYVIFYDKKLLLVKDPNYKADLTWEQEDELQAYNKNAARIDIALWMADRDLQEISVLDQMSEMA